MIIKKVNIDDISDNIVATVKNVTPSKSPWTDKVITGIRYDIIKFNNINTTKGDQSTDDLGSIFLIGAVRIQKA